MPFNKPIKVISSIAGGHFQSSPPPISGGGAVVIISSTPPGVRDDGTPLEQGDFWWNPSEMDLHIRILEDWQSTGGPDTKLTFSSVAPIKVTQVDDEYIHTFMPSDCPILP